MTLRWHEYSLVLLNVNDVIGGVAGIQQLFQEQWMLKPSRRVNRRQVRPSRTCPIKLGSVVYVCIALPTPTLSLFKVALM